MTTPPFPLNDAMRADALALDAIFRPFDRSDAPGLVVGVAREGRPIYRRGFGLASVRHGVANTPATRMRIASASKQFTCLAMILLAESRQVDLDAPADRYLTGMPAPRGRPTLRDFMTHTSGLRCTLEMSGLANGTALQPPDWQWRATLRQRDAHFPPGAGQVYCNGTYHLLSAVIDAVAGVPFERFISERILAPLGLHDTASVPDEAFMARGSAALHVPAAGGGWRSAPVDAEIRGDGGIVSTVDDALCWLAHLRRGDSVFSPATWQQLKAQATLVTGVQSIYGMGLKHTTYRGLDVVHHSGGLYGLNSQLITVPAHALDIAIMVNGAPASATKLAWSVIDTVLGPALRAPAPVLAPSDPYRHLLDMSYEGDDGFVIRFEAVDGRLAIGFSGMAPVPVVRDEGDDLRVGFEDVGMGPLLWSKRELWAGPLGAAPDRLPGRLSGRPHIWRRLDVPRGGRTAVLRPGRYRSDELDADAIVEGAQAPRLVLRGDYSGARRFDLQPLGDGVFAASGTHGAQERFIVHAREGGGFTVDSYRARGISFEPVSAASASKLA